MRLNTFHVFSIDGLSEYAERMENSRKKFLLSTIPNEVKGKVIRENHKLTYDEQITNLIF
jgi:hypothetical protein